MGRCHRPARWSNQSWIRTPLPVAFSPDGKRIVTGSDDKTARLWDAVTGHPLGVPMVHQHVVVLAAAFSPDGRMVFTGWDKTARLWDADTGQPIGPPMVKHLERRDCVKFGPDGRFLTTYDVGYVVSGTPRRRCPTTSGGWPPGSRPPPGWSWTSGARSAHLTAPAWFERRHQLEQLGGPPSADQRRCWTRTSLATTRARGPTPWRKEAGGPTPMTLTPRRSAPARATRSVREALARFHGERGDPERDAATFAESPADGRRLVARP